MTWRISPVHLLQAVQFCLPCIRQGCRCKHHFTYYSFDCRAREHYSLRNKLNNYLFPTSLELEVETSSWLWEKMWVLKFFHRSMAYHHAVLTGKFLGKTIYVNFACRMKDFSAQCCFKTIGMSVQGEITRN